jgi:hypothetical protein
MASATALRRWAPLALGTLLSLGCAAPSNYRDWSPELAELPYAQWHGNQATVHNVRDCSYYLADDQVVVEHYDKTFDLDKLQSVDFVVVPFAGMPWLAHTMLSFDFGGEDRLAVSAEVRLKRGESYHLLQGFLHAYELTYVVGDERDMVKVRTQYRNVDVYIYPTVATPDQSRALFADVFQRVNHLAQQPEFYDSLTNNCTTNIARHINHLKTHEIPPYDLRVLLPGYSDRLAYDLGLIKHFGSFDETRARAHVNDLAAVYRDDPQFSEKIRR